jgi:anti-sigma regulatory factor (Ser/Thr protein kinase)
MSPGISQIGWAGAGEVSTSSVVLLPYMPASVAAARWRLSAELREAGVADPAVGDAALVLSELLSNAILHASPLNGSTLQVMWALTGEWVEVSVSDGGSTSRPQTQHPPPSSTGGRGLAIVEYLSRCWGVNTNDHGTTVWAVVPAPGDGVPGGQHIGKPGSWAAPAAAPGERPGGPAAA